ncbi:MAG: hypothetical protein J6125_02085, partial [Clostridia bacterium]|nr:hypothetical protein [Clostridia bacterium]
FHYADEETYEAAKAYYLSHMTLADSDDTTLGGITFREIEGYAKKDGGEKDIFPYRYTMFAWSDEARVLIAFGSRGNDYGIEPERWLVYLTGRYPYVDWKTGLLRE